MGQRKGTTDRYAPVRGLVTEGNDANFPTDACIDVDNMEVLKNGISRRRLGLDREPVIGNFIDDFTEGDRASGLFSNYLWKAIAGASTTDLRVIQVGSKIKVYPDIVPLNTAPVYLAIDLNDAPYTTGTPVDSECQYAYGAGYILIVNANANPIAIEVTNFTQPVTLNAKVLNLNLRTTKLIDSGISSGGFLIQADDEYNLRNSGWVFETKCAENAEGALGTAGDIVTLRDPVDYFRDVNSRYPNAPELYNAHKLSAAEEAEALNSFSPFEADKINFGNTTPPLGHFIHDAYSFDAFSLMSAEGTPITNTNFTYTNSNRPTCCAFLNGHAIYGDIDELNATRIMVSQVVKDVNDLSKCYQDADPTAEEINDVLATDGFVLRPVGMGKPPVMREMAQGLAILCTNGVWVLRSTTGAFGATDFKIDRVAELDINCPQGAVLVDDVLFFAAVKGIYALSANQFGELQADSLTDFSIKGLYRALGKNRIAKSKVAYVPADNYIYWLVPEAATSGSYTSEGYYLIVFNIELGGFFQYSFSSEVGRPALHMPMVLSNTLVEEIDEPLTIAGGTEVVTTLAGDEITTPVTVTTVGTEVLGFFASHRVGGLENVVAKMDQGNMYDWYSYGSTFRWSYTSFIEFAYSYPESMIGGVAAPYIHSFFNTERTLFTGGGQTEANIPFPEIPEVSVTSDEYYRIQQTFISVLEDTSS